MVILQYISGRGKDQIDLMWLLQQPNLIDHSEVQRLMIAVMGEKSAVFPLRELERIFLQANVTNQ